jgi:hypothetical protein
MTDDLKERLLPCPFCGGHAAVRTNGDWTKSIWCLSCQAICGGGTLEYASQRWNTRAPDHHITDLEARLAAAEAGEDALAEALKSMKATCGFNRQMLAALAAYEARRMG